MQMKLCVSKGTLFCNSVLGVKKASSQVENCLAFWKSVEPLKCRTKLCVPFLSSNWNIESVFYLIFSFLSPFHKLETSKVRD